MSNTPLNDAPSLPEGILLEGIVTTCNDDGTAHIAPMGPIVDSEISQLLLRPFRTSTTFANLARSRQGVFHLSDDVELLARAAVGRLERPPKVEKAKMLEGWILSDACRWYAFRVESLDDRAERTQIAARVVDRGRIRDFIGFNRGKHAVVEAAILATRIDFLEGEHILDELQRLAVLVEKTGGWQERRAFEFLENYVREKLWSTGSTRPERSTS